MFFSVLTLHAQRQQLLKSVSTDACNCIEKIGPNRDFETALGLCLLKAASPKSEELEEVLGLDLSDLSNFERLGELLAPSLMMNCPAFIDLIQQLSDDGTLDFGGDLADSDDSPSFGQWSDIANGDLVPAYGGAENKSFVTTPIPNTNGVGLAPLRFAGKVTELRPGLVSEIVFVTDAGEQWVCYLDSDVPGQNLLKKGRTITLTYRLENRYNAGQGEEQRVRVVTRVE